jgi:hypothetical protein
VLAAIAAIALTAGPQDARSASYRSCPLKDSDVQPASGKPTYNSNLKAKATSCATALKVMRAYHACRSTAGVRCTRKVLKTWTCTGKRLSVNPTTKDFMASYTCTSGARGVKGRFQQI